MLTDHSYQLLAAAAEESLERIRQDRARAPQRLKPLLAYIEDNLFDPTLDVNQLKRSCGVRDNSVPIQFHSAVGRPPHGYIEDRRLETACRLLGDSTLKIWQISELLGYSSIQVFSRAFSRWSGQRPTLYRKKARQQNNGMPQNSAVAAAAKRTAQVVYGPDALRRALSGELSPDEAGHLIDRLLNLYPSCRRSVDPMSSRPASGSIRRVGERAGSAPQRSPLEFNLEGEEIERMRAEEIVRELENQGVERQQALIDDLRLTSPTLFNLLCIKSRDLAQKDPAKGLQIAELALKSLETLSRTIQDRALLADLRAQGWACLAQAQVATSEFEDAERGLAEAERYSKLAGNQHRTVGDIALAKGSLRREQQHWSEARELLEIARAHYHACGRRDLANRALYVQATVVYEEGNPSAAIPLLEEALKATNGDAKGAVRLSLFLNLLTAFTEAGQNTEAAEIIPQARQLALAFGSSFHRIRLRWLEGIISRELGRFGEAETALLEAREAFSEIHDAVDAALVCLDLAELYSKQGRLADLARLSASMAPLFNGLQNHTEALGSLKLFHRAAEEQSVTRVVLEEARLALRHTQRRRGV